MRPVRTFQVRPSLPDRLAALENLAYNLRWAWDPETISLFRRLGRDLWEENQHNPVLMLGKIPQERLTEAASKFLPGATNTGGKIPHKNFIDDFIFDRMDRDHIPHAGLSADQEFLRRAYLDATGTLPTADEVRAFVADPDPAKRGNHGVKPNELTAGEFCTPHGAIWDRAGNIYVTEWIPYGRVTKLRHVA